MLGVQLLIFFALGNQAASADPIPVDDNLSRNPIGAYLEYLEDTGKKLSIQDIVSPNAAPRHGWKQSPQKAISLGYTKSAYWVRFSAANRSRRDISLLLMQEYPLIGRITLYEPAGYNTFRTTETGAEYEFSKRPLRHRTFVFPMTLKAGESKTCYMRFETDGSMSIVLTMFSPAEFQLWAEYEAILLWLFCGIFLVMIVYNFFLFLSVRDPSYLYYILFLASFLLMAMSLNGTASQYLWPRSLWWGIYCRPILLGLIVGTFVQFLRNFTRMKENFPIINRVCIALVVANIAASASTPLLNNYQLSMSGSVVLAAISISIGLVFLIYMTVIKKSRQSLFVLVAYALFFICTMFYLLKSMGLLADNFITNWSMHLGAVMFLVLLSFGLADRINVMRNELRSLTLSLEDKVTHRTEELHSAMEELEASNQQLATARDELWGEMQLAKKIQTILLPTRPAISGYQITAYMSLAQMVGGDYYDVINLDGTDWIVIGDVSGHGVPAGLIMMMVQTAIHTVLVCEPDLKPNVLLARVNMVITQNIKLLGEDKYMTITVIACITDGVFYHSGLHQDIMIYRAATEKVELVKTDGMWLGIMDDIEGVVKNSNFKMNVNDTMLLFTDGITEAWVKGSVRDRRDAESDMFGDERLMEIMAKMGGRSCVEIKNEILQKLQDYILNDDITMIVLKRLT